MNNYPDGCSDKDIDDQCPDEAPEWKPPVSMEARGIINIIADMKKLSDEILEDEKCNFKK